MALRVPQVAFSVEKRHAIVGANILKSNIRTNNNAPLSFENGALRFVRIEFAQFT